MCASGCYSESSVLYYLLFVYICFGCIGRPYGRSILEYGSSVLSVLMVCGVLMCVNVVSDLM